jgi:hypothetical protein
MKYYNKKKEYRNKWTIVNGPPAHKAEEVKRWCQLNGSTDRFYFTLKTRISFDHGDRVPFWPWYFENSQDATAFKLIWSGK